MTASATETVAGHIKPQPSSASTTINITPEPKKSHRRQPSRANLKSLLDDSPKSPTTRGSSVILRAERSNFEERRAISSSNSTSNAAPMVTSDDNEESPHHSQQQSHQSTNLLLGALGPKMQTLLHRTIAGSGSASVKCHRRLRSEVDISWLPKSVDDPNNNNSISTNNTSSSSSNDQLDGVGQLTQSQSLLCLRTTPPSHPAGRNQQPEPASTVKSRSKCVRMKLFHQRLDKIFNQRQLRQWNETIRSPSSNPFGESPERRRQLELDTLPEPVRNLLAQINLRGPSTVGIFRKSPSAKHCRELRQKLESDSQSSIDDFQVTVIASVFKEWLLSLPDCLLMSHLYPQWIDVAKLIEQLQRQQHQRQQQQQKQQQQPQAQQQQHSESAHLPSGCAANEQAPVNQTQFERHPLQLERASATKTDLPASGPLTSTNKKMAAAAAAVVAAADDDVRDNGNDDDSRFDKDEDAFPSNSPSLRPSRSSLAATAKPTTTAAASGIRQPLDRARSCSTVMSAGEDRHQIVALVEGIRADRHVQQQVPTANHQCDQMSSPVTAERRTQWRSLASFKLSERRSECLRFVRQLLDNLNDSNLVTLRSFVSVLCRIASRSDLNKMSASNLGVCVGQSLLNDEQTDSSPSKSSAKLATYNFGRRLRRTRSYSILSSTFSSQSNPNLKLDTAQETAKYVPILVTFMIENARQLFGSDIVDLFPSNSDDHAQDDTITQSAAHKTTSCSQTDESISGGERSPLSFIDQVDGCDISAPLSLDATSTTGQQHTQTQTNSMRQLLVVNNQPVLLSPSPSDKGQESSYSSGSSSSTSGVHSESPAFSSELDSHNNSRVSNSPRSSVSSPSSMSSPSSSPIQDHADHHLLHRSDSNTASAAAAKKQADLSQTNLHDDEHVLSYQESQNNSNTSGNNYPSQTHNSLYRYHTLASSTPKGRLRNSLPPNGFSPSMGSLLNRVPKLPVRLSTSNYGGEAIIYNPKPSSSTTTPLTSALSVDASATPRNNNSADYRVVVCPHDLNERHTSYGISVKPLSAADRIKARANSCDRQQQQSAANLSHKDERLNQFLHQQHQQQRRPVASDASDQSALLREYHLRQQHNKSNYPIYSSSSNSNSLQPQQQHHNQYQQQHHQMYYSSLVCCPSQGNLFVAEPARSHVMSLRDYYLALQQRQQQQQNSYTLHRHSQPPPLVRQAALVNNSEHQIDNQRSLQHQLHHQHSHQASQYYEQQFCSNNNKSGSNTTMRQQRPYGLARVESSPLPFQRQQAATATVVVAANNIVHDCQLTAHKQQQQHQAIAVHRQPQTKLARIRQNQFNSGAIVNSAASRLYVPKDSPSSAAAAAAAAIKTKLCSASSADDHSSGNSSAGDSSDEFSNEWTESTMV